MALLSPPTPGDARPDWMWHARQLEDYYRSYYHNYYSAHDSPTIDDMSRTDRQRQWKRGPGSAYQCFSLEGNDGPPKRTRAKFSEEGNDKVQQVRRRGACLRCRMLKIPCSDDNLCTPCLSSAIKGSERRVLSFCYCLRTKFSDVNIFSTDSLDRPGTTSSMQKLGKMLDNSQSRTNLDSRGIVDAAIEWLCGEPDTPGTESIVALLTSATAHAIIRDSVNAEMADIFQAFLFSTSVTQTGWLGRLQDEGFSPESLAHISHLAGFELLSRFDRLLSPQSISKADTKVSHALTILVLGTTLAVGYSAAAVTSSASSAALLAPHLRHSPTLWVDMKEHLCQMLAHYIIFLAAKIGVKFSTPTEERLINKAVERWDKEERYVWAENPVYFDEEPAGEGAEPPVKEEAKAETTPWPVPIRCSELHGLPKSDSRADFGDSRAAGIGPPQVHTTWDPPKPGPEGGGGGDEDPPALRQAVKTRKAWLVRPHETTDGQTVNVLARVRFDQDRAGMFV